MILSLCETTTYYQYHDKMISSRIKASRRSYRFVELEFPAASLDGNTHRLVRDSLLQGLLIVRRYVFVSIDHHNFSKFLQQSSGPFTMRTIWLITTKRS